ncbi:MAG: flagellar basal body protein, partial [Sphingomonas sp.]
MGAGLNDILGSALSGLNAAQAGLRTVSTNIANVNTPGYAREQVSQTARVTAGQVTGVVAGNPTSVADQFLQSAVYSRAGDLGSAESTSSYLDQLQAMIGAP